MKNQDEQEFRDAAAEFAKGVSAYMRSTAEHLCEISKMSGMSVGDLLIDLALLARAIDGERESGDAKASEKAI